MSRRVKYSQKIFGVYMKIVFLFLLTFSTSVFSQEVTWVGADFDYHDEELPKCDREACLVVDGSEYGFYEFEDIDGYKFLYLNTESSGADINFSRACFRGEISEVVDIIKSLLGNTNRNYALNGGHIKVVKETFDTSKVNEIKFTTTIEHDYLEGLTDHTDNVKKCE